MTDQRDEHGFTPTNLDTLKERTASVPTGRVPLVDEPTPNVTDAAVVAELEALRNEINCVTFGTLNQIHRWLMDEIDRRVAKRGYEVKR